MGQCKLCKRELEGTDDQCYPDCDDEPFNAARTATRPTPTAMDASFSSIGVIREVEQNFLADEHIDSGLNPSLQCGAPGLVLVCPSCGEQNYYPAEQPLPLGELYSDGLACGDCRKIMTLPVKISCEEGAQTSFEIRLSNITEIREFKCGNPAHKHDVDARVKPTPPPTNTATKAHIQLLKLDRILELYGAHTTILKTPHTQKSRNAIDGILLQHLKAEERFSKTHHVFYHGQSAGFAVLQEAMTCYYVRKGKVDGAGFLDGIFRLLRPPKQGDQLLHMMDIMARCGRVGRRGEEGDHASDIVEQLLSVNTSLFGCLDAKECTFRYFDEAVDGISRTSGDLLNEWLSSIEIDEQMAGALRDTQDAYRKRGNLLQIFIPKEWAHHVVYLSGEVGYPARLSSSHSTDTRYTKNVLDLLESDPSGIKFQQAPNRITGEEGPKVDFTHIQARIHLNEMFSSQRSGIIIHNFEWDPDVAGPVPSEDLGKRRRLIRDIVTQGT